MGRCTVIILFRFNALNALIPYYFHVSFLQNEKCIYQNLVTTHTLRLFYHNLVTLQNRLAHVRNEIQRRRAIAIAKKRQRGQKEVRVWGEGEVVMVECVRRGSR